MRLAWVGGAVGLATLLALVVPVGSAIRLTILLLFAGLGPGCAVVAHLRLTDRVAGLGLAVTLSLSLYVAASTTMAWTGWWPTRAVTVALAAVTTVSCAVALARTQVPRWAG